MCSIDLDPCEVWREEERKARKEHRCACCNRVIKPGTKYLSHFSVFEGSPTTEALRNSRRPTSTDASMSAKPSTMRLAARWQAGTHS